MDWFSLFGGRPSDRDVFSCESWIDEVLGNFRVGHSCVFVWFNIPQVIECHQLTFDEEGAECDFQPPGENFVKQKASRKTCQCRSCRLLVPSIVVHWMSQLLHSIAYCKCDRVPSFRWIREQNIHRRMQWRILGNSCYEPSDLLDFVHELKIRHGAYQLCESPPLNRQKQCNPFS